MYWEKNIETMLQPALKKMQLTRLKQTIGQAMKSPFYGKQYSESGISNESVRVIDDIKYLPFTTKQDLRNNFPYGFLTVDKKETIRLHCSSGTTGNPIVIFHNQHDLDSWANLVARSMYTCGARNTDVFQNICGYGLFTGGLGFQYGAERLGALVIPAAAGNSRWQIKLMQDYGTTVIHTIPSFLGHFYEFLKESGIDPKKDTNLRFLIIGAEPHSEETRLRIQEMYGIKAYNSFGLSEMNGPGVAFECEYQNGMHLWEDAFYPEIIDPDTLETLPEGEIGELVLTTLDRQAMPIIRYRTRDLTRFITGECSCGRTHRRIDRIRGRSDDMFIYRGVNIFPMQIEHVLMSLPQVGNNYIIKLDTINGLDEMAIEVEFKSDWFTGDYGELEKLTKHITNLMRDEILVTPHIKISAPGSIPKSEGKAVRVKDTRQKF